MDFGQWCSPRCCTGCKCNVILPWVQEACLIDECKGKKCDSTEYKFVSKSVSASESHKAKPMLDEFWLWLILLILKERENVEGATESVSGLHRGYQTGHQNSCVERKRKSPEYLKVSPLCFPFVIFLPVPERNVSICAKELILGFHFLLPAALPICSLFVNKSVVLWASASLSSASSELWEEHAGKWELS